MLINSLAGNRESINFELEKKQMKRATNLKTVDIDSRKTLLKEDVDTSKKSKLGQNLFPLSFNKEKNNAKIDNKNKNLNFNKQIHSLGKQYEKSDSITDNNLPVFVSKYKFDKDYIENYNSLQPQIESQKNLSSALDDLRYINSPNFLSEDSNNPLMSWIKLKDFKPNSVKKIVLTENFNLIILLIITKNQILNIIFVLSFFFFYYLLFYFSSRYFITNIKKAFFFLSRHVLLLPCFNPLFIRQILPQYRNLLHLHHCYFK